MQAPHILVLTMLAMVAETTPFSEEKTLDQEIWTTLNHSKTSSSNQNLSRKKRYLLFPLGSSLQLVYDTTFPIIVDSAPFVFGSTAALAWQLPYELIGPLLKFKEKGFRRVDKPIRKQDKFRPEYMHYYKPVRYGSYPYENSGVYRQGLKRKHVYQQLNSYYNRTNNYRAKNGGYRRPVTTYVNPYFNELHRRTRRQLYVKVEKFLSTQRKDGRACLLKAVCEVSQASEVGKGTFMEEIIKAIFRFHPHHAEKEHDVYDLAAVKSHNCTEMYPTCDYSLWDFF